VVGTPRLEDLELIDATDAALQRGIDAARAGRRLGDVGNAIGATARKAGYGLLAHHGGHGVERAMHEDPFVPNEGRPGHGYRLRPGLVLALEPMLIADGTDDYGMAHDGWTLETASGARAAHSEHTIAITDEGPLVLTDL
jgi:methionyl aminopeptidase